MGKKCTVIEEEGRTPWRARTGRFSVKSQVSSRNLGLQPVKGRYRLAVVTMATKGGRPGGRCGT